MAAVGGAVARLAARQHGVVARRQLDALGVGQDAIEYRLATGALHRIHAGVYAVGHRRLSDRGRWMAAVLAGGEGAVLSHRAAAALWGFRETIASWIDVTVWRHRGGRRGIVFHGDARAHKSDRALCDGIPVTAVPRTLLDLACELRPTQLTYAFWEAERLNLLDPGELADLLARSAGKRGVRRLRELADRCLPPETFVRSVLERRLLELCRDSGLPLPSLNVALAGFEVDALWNDQRLVAELDGASYHRGAAAFERDRVRDAALQVAGYRVVRFTRQRLEQEAAAVTVTLRLLLA